MSSIRSVLLASLFASSISSHVVNEPTDAVQPLEHEQGDQAVFQEILGEAESTALHAALHNLKPAKFKHGAFYEDHTAVEAVHREDPSLATSIVMLARRQNTDATNSSSPASPTPTSAQAPESVSTSLVTSALSSFFSSFSEASSSFLSSVIPTDSSTSDLAPSPSTSVVTISPSPTIVIVTTTPSLLASSPAPAPSSPANTPSNSPSVPASSQSQPAPITTDIGSGTSTSFDVVVPSSSSDAAVSSAAAADSSSLTPTSDSSSDSGGGPGQTSVFLQTVSLPGGGMSTYLATSFVGGDVTATHTGTVAAGSPSGTSAGSLQSQAAAVPAKAWEWEMIGFIGGAIGALLAF